MQHLVDTNDFSDAQITQLLADAKSFKAHRPQQLLHDKLLVTLFFEARLPCMPGTFIKWHKLYDFTVATYK